MNGVTFGRVFTVAVNDLALLMVFLLIGVALLRICKPLKNLFLPAGLIGYKPRPLRVSAECWH